MMEAVVLLTPIFQVGIVALLGFLGGNQIFGLSPTQEATLTTKILAILTSGTLRYCERIGWNSADPCRGRRSSAHRVKLRRKVAVLGQSGV
jgi:hypothetical protein